MNLRSIRFGAAALLAAAAASASLAPTSAGHPDLNGTWDNGSGIDFIHPEHAADGSICVSGCAPAPAAAKPRLPGAGCGAAGPQLPQVSATVSGESGPAGEESVTA